MKVSLALLMSYGCSCLSGARCEWFAYGPADATATPSSLASLKSRMVSPFWCWLIQVVLEKGIKRVFMYTCSTSHCKCHLLLCAIDADVPLVLCCRSIVWLSARVMVWFRIVVCASGDHDTLLSSVACCRSSVWRYSSIIIKSGFTFTVKPISYSLGSPW